MPATAELQRLLSWRMQVTERTPITLDSDSKARSAEEALRPHSQQPATQRATTRNPSQPPAQPPTHCATARNPTEPPAEPAAQLPVPTLPAQQAPFAMLPEATVIPCAPIVGSGIRLVEAYGAGHSLHQQPHKQPRQQPRQRPHQRRSYWQLWDGCENASLRTLNDDLQERLQAAEEAVKEQQVHMEVLHREMVNRVKQQSCDSTKKSELFLQPSALHLLEVMKDLAAKATVRPFSAAALKEAASTAAPAALRVALPLSPSGEDLAGKRRFPKGLQGSARASSRTAEQWQHLRVPENPGVQNQSKTILASRNGGRLSLIVQPGARGPQGSAQSSSGKAEQWQLQPVPKNPGMQNQSNTIQAAKKGWHPSQIMQLGRKGPQGSALASSRKARSNPGSNWIRDCGLGAAAGCVSACVVAVCMSVL